MPNASESSSAAWVPDPAEARRDQRYTAPSGVKLTLQAPPDAASEVAELHDISLRGFGIVTRRYIAPGTTVMMRMGTQRIEAEVKHCKPQEAGAGYRAGVVVHRTVSERSASSKQGSWDTFLIRGRRPADDL